MVGSVGGAGVALQLAMYVFFCCGLRCKRGREGEMVSFFLQIILIADISLVAAKLLAETADEILYVCGDQSTDLRWYTKVK